MNNPSDPTHTLDLRLMAHNEVIRRFNQYASYVETTINALDLGVPTINVDLQDLEEAENDNEFYALLLLLLSDKAYEIILGENRDATWFIELVSISYFRGRRVAENMIPSITIENPAYHATKLRLVDDKALGNLTKNVNQTILTIQGIIKDQQITGLDVESLKRLLKQRSQKLGSTWPTEQLEPRSSTRTK